MKILNARLHGVIDYLVVLFLMAAPMLFGLSEFIAVPTYALGIVHLILTVFTDFPLGLIKIIPLKIHGAIELIVGILLMIAALIIGNLTINYTDSFFVAGFGIAVLFTWAITDYSAK